MMRLRSLAAGSSLSGVATVVLLAANVCAPPFAAHAQDPNPRVIRPHVRPKPLASNSQPGIASFLGNFTSVTTPSQVLGLARETNCSLTLLTGNYSLGTSLTYTRTGLISNYDKVLHNEAGLPTTPGVYANGCAAPNIGIGSRPAVFVGTTTGGITVFAGLNYSAIS